MEALNYLREDVWVQVAWALLHFIWQGAAIAGCAALVLRLWRARKANHRYAVCAAAMFAMAMAPVVTILFVRAQETPVASRSQAVQGQGEVAATATAQQIASARRQPRASQGAPVQSSGTHSAPTSRGSKQQPLVARLGRQAHLLQPWIVLAWLAGVLLLGARLLTGFASVHAIRRSAEAAGAEVAERAAQLCPRLGLRSCPPVAVSAKLTDAVAAGLLRPVILLPAPWVSGLPAEMLEAILAHELAHICRRDLWVNLGQRVVETLLFYHPAVWWLSDRMRLEREMCCDAMAVAATNQKVVYARALELASRSHVHSDVALAAGGGGRRQLLYRVRHVLGLRIGHEPPGWLAAGLLVLAVPLALAAASNFWLPTQPAAAAQFASDDQNAGAIDRSQQVYRVQPLDVLRIEILGSPDDGPIASNFLVEPDGAVSLGPRWGRVNVKETTVEEAERAIHERLAQQLANPIVLVIPAGKPKRWFTAVVPKAPYRIAPGDHVLLQVTGDPQVGPTVTIRVVEPSGQIAISARHGRVAVGGLSLEEAGNVIEEKLGRRLTSSQVSLTLADWETREIDPSILKEPYHIASGHLLMIQITGDPESGPVANVFLVEPSGSVSLGPRHGRLRLAGRTLEAAGEAIEERLRQYLANPQVAVTLAGWQMEATEEDRLRQLETEVRQLRDTVQTLRSRLREAQRP